MTGPSLLSSSALALLALLNAALATISLLIYAIIRTKRARTRRKALRQVNARKSPTSLLCCVSSLTSLGNFRSSPLARHAQALHGVSLQNKVYIVTGAEGSGVGGEVVQALFERGATVVVPHRWPPARVASTAHINQAWLQRPQGSGDYADVTSPREVPSPKSPQKQPNHPSSVGGNVAYMYADVTSLASLTAFTTAFRSRFYRLDGVVHTESVLAETTTQRTCDGVPLMFGVNVLAPYHMRRRLKRWFPSAPHVHIATTASAIGHALVAQQSRSDASQGKTATTTLWIVMSRICRRLKASVIAKLSSLTPLWSLYCLSRYSSIAVGCAASVGVVVDVGMVHCPEWHARLPRLVAVIYEMLAVSPRQAGLEIVASLIPRKTTSSTVTTPSQQADSTPCSPGNTPETPQSGRLSCVAALDGATAAFGKSLSHLCRRLSHRDKSLQ